MRILERSSWVLNNDNNIYQSGGEAHQDQVFFKVIYMIQVVKPTLSGLELT